MVAGGHSCEVCLDGGLKRQLAQLAMFVDTVLRAVPAAALDHWMRVDDACKAGPRLLWWQVDGDRGALTAHGHIVGRW